MALIFFPVRKDRKMQVLDALRRHDAEYIEIHRIDTEGVGHAFLPKIKDIEKAGIKFVDLDKEIKKCNIFLWKEFFIFECEKGWDELLNDLGMILGIKPESIHDAYFKID